MTMINDYLLKYLGAIVGKLELERKGSYRAHVELISRLHELTVRSQCAHGAP